MVHQRPEFRRDVRRDRVFREEFRVHRTRLYRLRYDLYRSFSSPHRYGLGLRALG